MFEIRGISYHLPDNCLTNEDLAREFPEWSVEKISEKTGIYRRYIASPETCSSDLAVESAKKLFKEIAVDPKEIDFILFCTQSPDYFLPTTACLIQERLGIRTDAGALDFNLGCSGYVYGLSMARSLIATGDSTNVLLITAETYSKFIHPRNKSVRTIFGDAAASTLVSASEKGTIGPFVFGTDGKGAGNLIVKVGGMRQPSNKATAAEGVDAYGNVKTDDSLFMNGAEIFNFTLREIPSMLERLYSKSGYTERDIDLFVFHQANKFMLDALRKKLKLSSEKCYEYMADCGNTVSSTIPIALSHALKEGRIRQGNKVVLLGFGVGYSWAGCVVEF